MQPPSPAIPSTRSSIEPSPPPSSPAEAATNPVNSPESPELETTTAASPTPETASLMVDLQGVNKVYANGSYALAGIDFQVNRGDFLFVTGPSGSGKSTLLKLLYGAEQPTQGKVLVDDSNIAELKGNRLSMLRRRIGIVFQDYKLIPRRTISENVAFVLWAQGFSRKEVQRRLPPTLKIVGLQHKADCFPEELSGGEQQRASIARAIVGTPPLILADEPTGNLDADNALQVMKIFQKLNGFGATILVTTHDERLVRLCNRPVVQLRRGRLHRPTR